MRIVVHDYAGHPFQLQLSRHLAERGHEVLHLHSTYALPRAALEKTEDDPEKFRVAGIGISESFQKYSLIKRRSQDIEYGRRLAIKVEEFRPEVVISANAPLDAQTVLLDVCGRHSIKFVIWLQDFLSLGMQRVLSRKLPVLGRFIGQHYVRLERRLSRRSDAMVLITDDFRPVLTAWGIPEHKLHVIENWAPLDEIRPQPRDNDWAEALGLTDKICFLYAGTLGLKHNPDLLIKLAEQVKAREEVRVVVISEGLGADWLRERKEQLTLDNLMLLEYQPYDRLSEVLASGDILIAILEPDAGVFSVPSKVLSYLCVGRPLLAAIPTANLAAKIIARNEAGRVIEPTDSNGFVGAGEELLDDSALRANLGGNALTYARQNFDIQEIAMRFEAVFRQVIEN